MLTCILRVWFKCPLSYPGLRLYFSSQNSKLFFSKKLYVFMFVCFLFFFLSIFSPLFRNPCPATRMLCCTCSQWDKIRAVATNSGTNIWLREFLLIGDMIHFPVWHHQVLISNENENSKRRKQSKVIFLSVKIGPLNPFFSITACIQHVWNVLHLSPFTL